MQRLLQSPPNMRQYMFGAHENLPSFGARPFPPEITTSMVQDVMTKITGVDCMMR
jgi:hypothetical protein